MTAFTTERIESYCEAEGICPDARNRELDSFRDYLADGSGKKVLELGSGNGTLTRCLQAMDWTVDTADIAFQAPAGVRRHYTADIADGLGFLPNAAEYDAVVSLAVLHHVVSDGRFLPDALARDIAAVTKPDGIVILQDVPAPLDDLALEQMANCQCEGAQNTIQIFANLVDAHSVPTHNGVYLNMTAIAEQLSDQFSLFSRFYHRCDWQFQDADTAVRYVQSLFNLDLSLIKLEQSLAPSLNEAGQGVSLPWALDCLVMRRRS